MLWPNPLVLRDIVVQVRWYEVTLVTELSPGCLPSGLTWNNFPFPPLTFFGGGWVAGFFVYIKFVTKIFILIKRLRKHSDASEQNFNIDTRLHWSFSYIVYCVFCLQSVTFVCLPLFPQTGEAQSLALVIVYSFGQSLRIYYLYVSFEQGWDWRLCWSVCIPARVWTLQLINHSSQSAVCNMTDIALV